MNRSLEALAIFTLCLGGILAVVRCSTTQRSAEPAVVEGTAPAKNSGSAAEQTNSAHCDLAYLEGCGLDRNDGQVYAPLSPLLSSREVALLAIRSQPIPLVVLPEAGHESTGYDAAYDSAMDMFPSKEDRDEGLARAELEAEYAAAQLAAAVAGAANGTFSAATELVQNTELSPPSPTWNLISSGLAAIGSDLRHGSTHLKQSYVDPFSRGIENRLQQISLPTLVYPRAKTEARRHLLLRERAEAQSVTWDDYLGFASRKLPVKITAEGEQRVARQKSPRNVLWPR